MNKFIIMIAVFLGPIISYGKTSYVPFSMTLREGSTEFSGTVEYFKTLSVSGVDGDKSSLDSGVKHERYQSILTGKYGFTDHFEGRVGVLSRYIKSELTTDYGTGNDDFVFTRSGSESTVVGLKYSFKELDNIKFALDGYYKYSLHSSDVYESGEPTGIALGDEGREYAAGVGMSYRSRTGNIVEMEILYRSPGEFLSKEIFGDFKAALVWTNTSLYAGVENIQSLNGDPYTDDPENKPAVYQGTSGQYNSINRQWVAPYVGMNITMGQTWAIEFRYTQVTEGRSTDLGPKFLIGLRRRSSYSGKDFKRRDGKFKQYRVEGIVEQVSKSRKIVVINRGIEKGLKVGMKVDFFYFNYEGGNILIATGQIIKVNSGKSMVKIRKKFSRRRVSKGSVARADEITD